MNSKLRQLDYLLFLVKPTIIYLQCIVLEIVFSKTTLF